MIALVGALVFPSCKGELKETPRWGSDDKEQMESDEQLKEIEALCEKVNANIVALHDMAEASQLNERFVSYEVDENYTCGVLKLYSGKVITIVGVTERERNRLSAPEVSLCGMGANWCWFINEKNMEWFWRMYYHA